MKTDLSDRIKDCGEIGDTIINKFTEQARHLDSRGSEPGVKITKNLSSIIEETVNGAIHADCDLFVIVREILINAFRCDYSVPQEAHKTILLLVKEIMQPVFKYKGDIYRTIDGLLNGIEIIAKEKNLNVQEALVITKEDIVLCVEKVAPDRVQEIRNKFPIGLRQEGESYEN